MPLPCLFILISCSSCIFFCLASFSFLIYEIILFSSRVVSLLSEGESTPRKPGRMLPDCPCLVLCRGPNPQLTEVVLDLFQSMVLHQLMSGDQLLQAVTPVCFSILYHLFSFTPRFLLPPFVFPYFTDVSSLYNLLSVLFEYVLFCLVLPSFIKYPKS